MAQTCAPVAAPLSAPHSISSSAPTLHPFHPPLRPQARAERAGTPILWSVPKRRHTATSSYPRLSRRSPALDTAHSRGIPAADIACRRVPRVRAPLACDRCLCCALAWNPHSQCPNLAGRVSFLVLPSRPSASDSPRPSLQVPRNVTVEDLKRRVAEATSISTESQRLLSSGNEMDGAKTLGYYCKTNRQVPTSAAHPPSSACPS